MKKSVSSRMDATNFAKIINPTQNIKLNNVESFSQQDAVCMENDAISYILNPPRLSRVIAMVASKK